MSAYEEDRLLQRVLSRGWCERTRREFLVLFGTLIRRSILYHVRRCFGGRHVSGLVDYLAKLESGSGEIRGTGIYGEVLAIAADTWQDVVGGCWSEPTNLVTRWHDYAEAKAREAGSARDFETYLKGNIGNVFWGHLRRRKARFGDAAIDEEAEASIPSAHPDEVPVDDEVTVYWDLLLRCSLPDPVEIEESVIRLRRDHACVLVWACAALKEEFHRNASASQLENLVAFAAFYCSQGGEARVGDAPPDPGDLSYERVFGRHWRWEEDVCRKVFRKRIRKDRPMQQIQKRILGSPYRDLIEEVT